MKGSFIIGIFGPIGIGLLHNNLPFFNQSFQDLLDIEAFILFALEPQGEIFKVDEVLLQSSARPFQVSWILLSPRGHPEIDESSLWGN